jgi:hypothetical protein
MEEETSKDIRRLLKTFGVKADQAIVAQLKRTSRRPLRVRIVLEDVTDYGGAMPREKLSLEVEGEIRE